VKLYGLSQDDFYAPGKKREKPWGKFSRRKNLNQKRRGVFGLRCLFLSARSVEKDRSSGGEKAPAVGGQVVRKRVFEAREGLSSKRLWGGRKVENQ